MFLPLRLLALSLLRLECWKYYLDYERSLLKLVNCTCRIQFIEQCIQADIIPRFLKFRIPENGCFEPIVVHNFQRNLLKNELSKAKKTQVTQMNVIETKRSVLRDVVPVKLIPSIALSRERQRPLFDVHDTVRICDEDIAPPRYVLDTLALGPKNAILDKFDPKETLAQIDSLLFNCKKGKVSGDIINDINVETFKYIKSMCQPKISTTFDFDSTLLEAE